MVKRLLFLFFCSFSGFGWLASQSVTPFVTSTAGDFFLNPSANASLSFTVGEMTMVETFFNQGHFLTQGFQQPQVQAISVEDAADFWEEFVVFPNPASDFLNVRYRLRYPGRVKLELVNLNGVRVLPGYDDRYIGGIQEDALELDGLSQGFYILRVSYDVPARNIHHLSFHKINVIQ